MTFPIFRKFSRIWHVEAARDEQGATAYCGLRCDFNESAGILRDAQVQSTGAERLCKRCVLGERRTQEGYR